MKTGRNEPCPCGSGKKYKKCHGGVQNKTKTMKITSDMFISQPYLVCPNCKAKNYGVLDVYETRYIRECTKCDHQETIQLPAVHKQLVYLDQFVINKITDSLNKTSQHHHEVSKDLYWIDLYKLLDNLLRAQSICCPDSVYRYEESIVHGEFKYRKRLYEHLSRNVTLKDHSKVMQMQILKNFKKYLGLEEKDVEYTLADILNDKTDIWNSRLNIGITRDISQAEINSIRNERDVLHAELEKVFKTWQTNKSLDFKTIYINEASSFGTAAVKRYLTDVSSNDHWSMLSSSSILIQQMIYLAKSAGKNSKEAVTAVLDFLHSDVLKEIPYVKISSLLFAALARKASSGQKNLDKGMINDINAIAAYLPYMDVMFVDDAQAGFLRELKKSGEINYPAKIYSTNNKVELLDYLQDIFKHLTPEHKKLVEEVYGRNWDKPFISVLGDL